MRIFDIKEVSVSLGGIPLTEGVVSIGISPVGVRFDSDSSADGMVTRWATHERRHKINIILKGASPENQKLSAIHAADVAAPNGAGVLVLKIEDGQGATIALTDTGWIDGLPEKVMAASPQDVTWVLTGVFDSPLNLVIGGNS